MGLFALSPHARRVRCLRTRASVEIGASTGERNFLPFIRLARRARRGRDVRCGRRPMEAVGVNTPDELAAVERYLTSRAGSGAIVVTQLSIVIPAYNEERFIGTLLEQIRARRSHAAGS